MGRSIVDRRPWLGHERSLERLNALAEKQGLKTESGRPVRFVQPGDKDAYYEIKVYETGRVETRPESLHDYFNALAWLASAPWRFAVGPLGLVMLIAIRLPGATRSVPDAAVTGTTKNSTISGSSAVSDSSMMMPVRVFPPVPT